MTIRFAAPDEIGTWDDHILANPDGGNIFQSKEMATIKAKAGWKVRFIMADSLAITLHERSVPTLGKLWYFPKGPGVSDVKDLITLLPELREFARSHGAFVVKLESELDRSEANVKALKKAGLIHSHAIQPNSSTVVLDLSGNLDDMMTAFPQNTRHAIKRAFRDGVKIKEVKPTKENFIIMLELMHETMQGKSMFLREASYYHTFWGEYASKGIGHLFFAHDGNKPIAGAFVMVFGKKATYKDGGSTRKKSIYGASHALQWHIIEWLKDQKVVSYDLCGTPPAAEISNKNHPHYGIGLFKTGFKKEITEYIGAYDLIVRPSAYKLWARIAERVITRFYFQILKKYFY